MLECRSGYLLDGRPPSILASFVAGIKTLPLSYRRILVAPVSSYDYLDQLLTYLLRRYHTLACYSIALSGIIEERMVLQMGNSTSIAEKERGHAACDLLFVGLVVS